MTGVERWAFSSGVSKMATVTAQRHPKSKRPMPSDHITCDATALMQDLFLVDGSLAQACDSIKGGRPLLGAARVQEIRELIFQAQRAALLAMEPLLQAQRLLQSMPEGLYHLPQGTTLAAQQRKLKWMRETMEPQEVVAEQELLVREFKDHDADQVKLRNARAALRDAMTYFLVPQTLGVDSKHDFVNVIWAISAEGDQDTFSSQMQNAYVKLLRNLQEWLAKTNVATGKPKGTEEQAPISISQPEPEPLGLQVQRPTLLPTLCQPDPELLGSHLQMEISNATLMAWQWQSLGMTHVELSDVCVEAVSCADDMPSKVELFSDM